MATKNFKVNNGLTTPLTTFEYNDGNAANLRQVTIQPATTSANYSLQLPTTGGALVPAVLGAVTINGGGIDSIAITSGGSGYTVAPSVIISGDGQFGIASAVITNGVVTQINIDNSGSGYTSATATVGTSGSRYLTINNNDGNLSWQQISTIDLQAVNSAVLFSNNGVIEGNLSFTFDPNMLTAALGCTFPGGQNATMGYSNVAHNYTPNSYTKIQGDTGLTLAGTREMDDTAPRYITIAPPYFNNTWANYTLTLPSTPGEAGQAIITDGTGNLSWLSIVSGFTNGTSNATIPVANGNLYVSTNSVANVLTVNENVSTFTSSLVAANFSVGGSNANINGSNIFFNVDTEVDIVTGNGGFGVFHGNLNGQSVFIFPNSGSNNVLQSTADDLEIRVIGGSNIYANATFRAIKNSFFGANANSTANVTGILNVSNVVNVGDLNVTGNVTSNLLPNANITYDLGSSTQRWKDIWLANSTIYLGNATISDSTNGVTFGNANIIANAMLNGNSNITITANANITFTAKSNSTMVISDTGANITGTANISGNVRSNTTIQSLYGNTATGNAASFMATGTNTVGGTGFLDFLFANNSANATTGRKTFRIDGNGKFEIINSAYSASLLSVTDDGNVNVSGGYFVGGRPIFGPTFAAYPDTGTTAQAITSGSLQKVTFDIEEWDPTGDFASSRFTPSVAGYYQFNATVRLDAGGTGTGECMIVLYKNGTEYKRGWNSSGVEFASNWWSMSVSAVAYANGSTDYFEIYVQQTSGATRNVTRGSNLSYFNGCMVRGA